MSETLTVLLRGAVAGRLERLDRGLLRFEYLDEYRFGRDAVPLSISMPLQISSHPDEVIRPWLWGLLPDNQDVIDRWARQFHVSGSSPFSLLSTPIGEDCAGAVQFVAEQGVRALRNSRGRRRMADSRRSRRTAARAATGFDQLAWSMGSRGSSALQARKPRQRSSLEDGRWGVPSGAIPTTHILKPAVAGFDDHDLNEHLCLAAARRAGLTAARTRVEQFGAESAIVVERYDRHTNRRRDAAHPSGRPLPGARQVADAEVPERGRAGPPGHRRSFRRVMPSRVAVTEVCAVHRRARLELAHRRHGRARKELLAAARTGQVRLAPLYDVASALPYREHERRLKLAMKIGGEYEVYPRRNTWPEAARELEVDPEALSERVLHLAEMAPDAFADAANDPDVVALNRDLPTRLVGLVAERSARCSELLRTGMTPA